MVVILLVEDSHFEEDSIDVELLREPMFLAFINDNINVRDDYPVESLIVVGLSLILIKRNVF